jgi:tRNA(Arg) A34 adenosine deaminase TadA
VGGVRGRDDPRRSGRHRRDEQDRRPRAEPHLRRARRRRARRFRLAHAEINALLALSSAETYEGWTIYSALEPCHACLAAAFAVRIGTVSYAARDEYGGAVGKLLPSRDHLAHPVRIEGPLEGPAGVLPEALLVAHFLWRRPEGDVIRFYEEHRPDLVALARELPAPDGSGTLPASTPPSPQQ